MKKLVTALLAGMMVLSLCACGGGNKDVKADNKADSKTETKAAVSGKTYETEKISVFCPDGWLAVTQTDFLSDNLDEKNENGVVLYKGAKDEDDAFMRPSITITYYPADQTMPDNESLKSFYTKTEDLEPLKLTNYTLTGYVSNGGDDNTAILWTEKPDPFDVTLVMSAPDGEFALEDDDVQAILDSFKVK